MTIMTEEQRIDKAIEKKFNFFMKRFGINKMLRTIGALKQKGVSAYLLFAFTFGLVFTRKNLYETIAFGGESPSFGKNTPYRFLSAPSVNWEAFIPMLSAAVIPEVDKLTSETRKTVNILDDTPYWRNRSKKVELLSRCYDHSEKKYYKGFTMLNLGWSDGQTYMPVNFRILASGNDENLLEGARVKEDRRTLATRRRNEARESKPKLSLKMLEEAKGTPAQAKYVLFDSWFASPSFILSVKGLGYDSIARLKNHEKYLYLYNGELLSISKLFNASKKRRGRSRYLLSVTVDIRHNDFEDAVPAKIVYVRDRKNRKKWIAIISTDTTLTEEEIIEYYGKRWDIEPFHKVIKSTLRLTKEFQTRSFDSIVAHAAIVLARYIFLSLENREDKDHRSIGEMFFLICEELSDISFEFAFDLLMSLFHKCLIDNFKISNYDVEQIVNQFINALPFCIKKRLAS